MKRSDKDGMSSELLPYAKTTPGNNASDLEDPVRPGGELVAVQDIWLQECLPGKKDDGWWW